MPKIVFIGSGGREHVVCAPVGQSLMRAAVDNLIPGILADCGGSRSCATCHVHVAAEWRHRMPAIATDESDLLEGVVDPSPDSRLSCQITLTDELDGILVRLPAAQH